MAAVARTRTWGWGWRSSAKYAVPRLRAVRFAQNDASLCFLGLERWMRGGLGSGFDDADDGDGEGVLDVVEGEGGGGVAGDDEELGALLVEELCAGDGVAGDGLAGFGAVGEAGGVAEVDVVGAGDAGGAGRGGR